MRGSSERVRGRRRAGRSRSKRGAAGAGAATVAWFGVCSSDARGLRASSPARLRATCAVSSPATTAGRPACRPSTGSGPCRCPRPPEGARPARRRSRSGRCRCPRRCVGGSSCVSSVIHDCSPVGRSGSSSASSSARPIGRRRLGRRLRGGPLRRAAGGRLADGGRVVAAPCRRVIIGGGRLVGCRSSSRGRAAAARRRAATERSVGSSGGGDRRPAERQRAERRAALGGALGLDRLHRPVERAETARSFCAHRVIGVREALGGEDLRAPSIGDADLGQRGVSAHADDLVRVGTVGHRTESVEDGVPATRPR